MRLPCPSNMSATWYIIVSTVAEPDTKILLNVVLFFGMHNMKFYDRTYQPRHIYFIPPLVLAGWHKAFAQAVMVLHGPYFARQRLQWPQISMKLYYLWCKAPRHLHRGGPVGPQALGLGTFTPQVILHFTPLSAGGKPLCGRVKHLRGPVLASLGGKGVK